MTAPTTPRDLIDTHPAVRPLRLVRDDLTRLLLRLDQMDHPPVDLIDAADALLADVTRELAAARDGVIAQARGMAS